MLLTRIKVPIYSVFCKHDKLAETNKGDAEHMRQYKRGRARFISSVLEEITHYITHKRWEKRRLLMQNCLRKPELAREKQRIEGAVWRSEAERRGP